MRALTTAILLGLGTLLAAAPPVRPKPYTPDLRRWRLEVAPDLGGWSGEARVALRIKLVDPGDPDPPKESSRYGWEEGEEEAAGPDEDTRSAEQLRQARLAREEAERLNAWRQRRLRVWFNGTEQTWAIRVGSPMETELTAQNGENRLEILEPDSGQRVVRSWWVSTARTRLRIVNLQTAGEWASGSLQVVEPDGLLAEAGRRTASGGMLRWSGEYTHDTPPPGTYTLRWTAGWRGGRPTRLRVEAVLDGGTDRERRWTFERLILPGAGPVTLGTIDVEP